jgi:hypothetical protein
LKIRGEKNPITNRNQTVFPAMNVWACYDALSIQYIIRRDLLASILDLFDPQIDPPLEGDPFPLSNRLYDQHYLYLKSSVFDKKQNGSMVQGQLPHHSFSCFSLDYNFLKYPPN